MERFCDEHSTQARRRACGHARQVLYFCHEKRALPPLAAGRHDAYRLFMGQLENLRPAGEQQAVSHCG